MKCYSIIKRPKLWTLLHLPCSTRNKVPDSSLQDLADSPPFQNILQGTSTTDPMLQHQLPDLMVYLHLLATLVPQDSQPLVLHLTQGRSSPQHPEFHAKSVAN